MERRKFIAACVCATAVLAEEAKATVRGKLIAGSGGKPAIEAAGGKIILLEGDKDTDGVLRDQRVIGMDFEAVGRFKQPDVFVIDPIHTKSIFVHKNGKRLYVTYWCDVCSIRTYTPGKCWCCQEETVFDPRERYDQ